MTFFLNLKNFKKNLIKPLSGIYLLVHNQTKSLISLANGVHIAPNFETYIGVSRTWRHKEKHPYSDCLSDLTPFSNYSQRLFDYFAHFNVTQYDQDLCIDLCYQDNLIKRCNCCSLLTSRLLNAGYCVSDTELACENNFKILFTTQNTNKFCRNVCRNQCTRQIFTYATSLAKYPTYSKDQTLDDRARENLRFIVNYSRKIYTSTTENPAVTFDTLIGSIGGQLGFFIGMSLVSVLEVFELLTELLMLFYRIKIQRPVQA